ncbi:MAG: aminotransferase class V-fold PLP-dependent enzyme [Bacteroidota bacterium]
MLEKINTLATIAQRLEPSQEDRDHWVKVMHEYANAFLNELPEKPAYEEEPQVPSLPDLESGGKSMEELIEFVNNTIDSTGINPASPKHFGYIPGGGLYTTALGDYLVAVSNRYAGMFFANPGAVRIENQLLRWMCEMIGYPDTALGNLTSGGSIANLMAVTTARDHFRLKATEFSKACIYLSEQVHHCVQKATRIAGMREAPIRYIPLDENYKMKVDELRKQIEKDIAAGYRPFLLVASAGTTDTGAIDPLDELADVATEFNMWYHIDAAYGGFFVLVDDLKEKFKGIERSDSLTIDPHKGFFISYGLGAFLVRNVETLFKSQFYTAGYLQDALGENQELSPADLSPELTKHFRGLRMWMSMQLLGIEPIKAALEEKALLTQYFYEKVQELGFQVGPFPELSVMIYRYVPEDGGSANTFNEALVAFIRKDGRIFLSSTTIEGVYWIRMAVLSFRTHLKEVDLCLDILKEGLEYLKS